MNANLQLATARQNMVENQVRPWEVLDPRVLEVLATVPREAFVPAAHRELAYMDVALPLGYGEVMLKPVIEGRILQAVLPQADERVLEIGTGSGYFAACLGALGARVTSIDCRAEFVAAAQAKFRAAPMANVECLHADALAGFAPKDKFDAIVVTAAVAELPAAFGEWLAAGGRVFVIRGESPVQQAVLLQRADDGSWLEDRLFETDVPYLSGAEPQPRFRL